MSGNSGDNLKQDLDILDSETEIQKAYDTAQKINWTIARHSAAMSMGCTILSGVFGPELKGLQDKGVYPNALRDVVIVLWLLSRTEAEVIRVNSRQNIDEAIAEAYLWAEAEGIKYGSPKYLDGVRTLTEIVGSVFTSFYAVDGKKPEAPRKNDSRPHGRSGRPITRSKPAGMTPTMSETK
jgi:hypothetical protein